MNKRLKKKKQVHNPDLQTAWNVVAEHLKKDGGHAYFIDTPLHRNEDQYRIRCVNPERVIVACHIDNN